MFLDRHPAPPYHRRGMTLRVDIDHLRRILGASLPTGARAAELFIESRLSVHVGVTMSADGGAAAPTVERRWETGAHLRRFSHGGDRRDVRHESFVLDAPTAGTLEALALHPEAVAVEWLDGPPPLGIARDNQRSEPVEARLADASPSALTGAWSSGFLATATGLLSSWIGAIAGELAGGPASGTDGFCSASLDASVQEILLLATDRDPARDTRSSVVATLRASVSGGGASDQVNPLEEIRSAATLEELARFASKDLHPAVQLSARAGRRLEAAPAPRGEMPVVFASPSGGFLLHEVCGHLLEADHVLRGVTPFASARGLAIASPLLTLVDDGSIPGMRGSALFDDEGVACRRTPLIMDGTL